MNGDEVAQAGTRDAPGAVGLSLVLVVLNDEGHPHLAYLPDSPAPAPDGPRPARNSTSASPNGQEPHR